jgi:hypothetical protein
MENANANMPWLAQDVVAIIGDVHDLPKHPEKLLPMFDPDKKESPEDPVNKFMLAARLMNVQHEDVI